jgi:hypothetical protein
MCATDPANLGIAGQKLTTDICQGPRALGAGGDQPVADVHGSVGGGTRAAVPVTGTKVSKAG